MKLLLFGGVGFIGTNVVLHALSKGHTVIGFDNLCRPGVLENLSVLTKQKKFQFLCGDVRNKEDFAAIPKNIDCIINFAANPSVPRSIREPIFDFETNVIGHLNILEYSKNHGKIPVILASTNKVYTDKINALTLRETKTRYVLTDAAYRHGIDEFFDVGGHEGFANSPYGTGKLSAEKYTREYWHHYGIPMVANRMSCIYGLYQKGVAEQGWMDHFLRAKLHGWPLTIYGDGKQVRDALFGSDVAELYLYEAEHINNVNGKTFNVGGGTKDSFHTSLLEIIALIDKNFPGKKLKYSFAPWRASDQRAYVSDIRKVIAVTGWKPTTTILAGLRAMWAAYEA